MQAAADQLAVGTIFNVVNGGALNAAKTLMLARHLIVGLGFECTLALGIDRRHRDRQQQSSTAIPADYDTGALIRDFQRVRRRFHADVRLEVENEQVWHQSERFEERWCDSDVLVACVLANEGVVRRHGLQHAAVEIVRMELALDEAGDEKRQENGLPRMISALGFVNDNDLHGESSLNQSGLVHCADASKALRGGNQSIVAHEAHGEHGKETLFAQYRRYGDSIKSKL